MQLWVAVFALNTGSFFPTIVLRGWFRKKFSNFLNFKFWSQIFLKTPSFQNFARSYWACHWIWICEKWLPSCLFKRTWKLNCFWYISVYFGQGIFAIKWLTSFNQIPFISNRFMSTDNTKLFGPPSFNIIIDFNFPRWSLSNGNFWPSCQIIFTADFFQSTFFNRTRLF